MSHVLFHQTMRGIVLPDGCKLHIAFLWARRFGMQGHRELVTFAILVLLSAPKIKNSNGVSFEDVENDGALNNVTDLGRLDKSAL